MKRRTVNVSAPLSSDELDLLAKFATNSVVDNRWYPPVERVNMARTTQWLVKKGMLLPVPQSIPLITPEGLAALLDSVPVQRITSPSPRSDESTRLSKAART